MACSMWWEGGDGGWDGGSRIVNREWGIEDWGYCLAPNYTKEKKEGEANMNNAPTKGVSDRS